jgi:hypothetical protein
VRANRSRPPEWLTSDFLDFLVENNTNGREIKNIVRIGYDLALHEKRDMTTIDLLQGLDALKQFDTDFSEWLEQRKVKETHSK